MCTSVNSKAFYTVKAENRQFEEAQRFLNEVKRLYFKDSELRNRTLKKVQIAGTNGKGSTAAMLSEILTSAGYKTGLYTSPALINVNERIRLNGDMISDDDLIKYIPVIDKAQRIIGRTFGGFERITAASMLYYIENDVDIAVMETGLGGRYDTVSAVEQLILASITSIDMDHMAMLGNNLEEVAYEKCGIMRPDIHTVIHTQHPDVDSVISKCAAVNRSKIVQTDSCMISPYMWGKNLSRQHFTINAHGTEYDVDISLIGRYQRENAANALLCALELRELGFERITKEAIENGFKRTCWEGRLQVVRLENCMSDIIIDGAHNPHAMKEVADFVLSTGYEPNFVVLLSVMKDKDIRGIIEQLKRFATDVICYKATDRACDVDELLSMVYEAGMNGIRADDLEQAIETADAFAQGECFFALGSLYLAGQLLERNKKNEDRYARNTLEFRQRFI